MISLNFATHALVSTFLGSMYVINQLLMNNHILKRADQKLALPVANGWFSLVQSSLRSASPLATGLFFDIEIAHDKAKMNMIPLFGVRILAFDHLAVVGLG